MRDNAAMRPWTVADPGEEARRPAMRLVGRLRKSPNHGRLQNVGSDRSYTAMRAEMRLVEAIGAAGLSSDARLLQPAAERRLSMQGE